MPIFSMFEYTSKFPINSCKWIYDFFIRGIIRVKPILFFNIDKQLGNKNRGFIFKKMNPLFHILFYLNLFTLHKIQNFFTDFLPGKSKFIIQHFGRSRIPKVIQPKHFSIWPNQCLKING